MAGVSFGDGRDGNLILDGITLNLNTGKTGSRNYADGIAYKVNSNPITATIDIGTTPNGIIAGDYVFLVNVQGASGDYADVGNYELLRVSSVGATTIVTETDPVKSYDGTTFSNQKVVIQRVPQYNNVTISNGGQITASAYDRLTTIPISAAGYYTGIVALIVRDTLLLDSSSDKISVNGKGYQGGQTAPSNGNYEYGYTGESTSGYSTSRAGSVNPRLDGGGGAGKGGDGSGGGGGYGTGGGDGYELLHGGSDGGVGANAFGVSNLFDATFGGGGGSGGSHDSGRIGAAGGAGGGLIHLIAKNIINRGVIEANGADGTDGVWASDLNSGAGGGGGAGGSIYVSVSDLESLDDGLTAVGGDGGAGRNGETSIDGGDGGDGRIRVDFLKANDTDFPATTQINAITIPDAYTSELELAIRYYYEGYVDVKSVPAAREIRIYSRATGQLEATTTSSGNGYYYLETTTSGEHYIVALDEEAGPYNALINDRLLPIGSIES
jgi:hypothetical protein